MRFMDETNGFFIVTSTLVLAVAIATDARASFHSWDINEIFSNEDGTIQFIELRETEGLGGQHQLSIPSIDFTTNTNIFAYDTNLNPLIPTEDNYFLMGTEGFANLPGAPEPDYIIPDNFFSVTGDMLNFAGFDIFIFGQDDLPLDGIHSLNSDLSTGVNSPTHFSVDRKPGFVTAPLLDPLVEPIAKGDIEIELELVAEGLTAPLVLAHAHDDSGRLYIADQTGLVWILEEGGILPNPFLDISDRLVTLGFFGTMDEADFDERGLLGLAFHPFYNEPNRPGFGKVYTYSSEPNLFEADFTVSLTPGNTFDHQSVIAEWCVDPNDPDRIDPASRREIMRIDQPQFNHDGGTVAFGPDGYLYISLGDGGGANDRDFDNSQNGHGPTGNGQNIDTILGSLVRIDPLDPGETADSEDSVSGNGRYRIPQDNPFVGEAGLDELFAFGFRNPFRFSFDELTSDVILGDVGQDHIEEVNLVQAGGNYGWNVKEGTFEFDPNTGRVSNYLEGMPGLIDPVLQYDHDEGITVIGGYLYHGCEIRGLSGQYVFGDFSGNFSTPSGRLFYADLESGAIQEFILGREDRELGLYVKSFGQDANGDIYLLGGTNLGPFGSEGQVYKIVSVDQPAPPEISLLAIKAGKDRQNPLDSVKIAGTLDCGPPETDTIHVCITDPTGIYGFAETLIDLVPEDFEKGRFRYKGARGGILSLQLDFNKGKFAVDVRDVDLRGLVSPVSFELQADPLDLVLAANESVINKKKPIPICLLSGVADALRVDKATVRTTSKGDLLIARGGIAAMDFALDLTQHDVTVTWGDFSEIIEAGSFTNKKGRKFSYKKPKEKVAAIAKIDIDLDKCIFLLQIKNAPPLQNQGNVFFEIVADTFSANNTVSF